jgi:uncharacterized protein
MLDLVIMAERSVLWRSLDGTGHEACRVFTREAEWHLEGSAVFSHEQQPCRLDYHVRCDASWTTRSGRVSGWLGQTSVDLEIAVDTDRNWRVNGVECASVAGCIDLDLNFSPSTNLLPIRRLNLEVGQEAEVKAAWLRFPSFELETLVQIYRRIDQSTYQYRSEPDFVADLEVDEFGLVTNYRDLWLAEATT